MNVAFYSYKGGVGRTQLVANLAQYLYKYENKKVLLMDWDLEAPGLHFYFGKDNKDIKKEGIIDVLSNYVKFARFAEPQQTQEEDFPCFTEENIINLVKDEKTKGRIDLIAGGIYEDFTAYRRKIIDFNWIEFYDFLDGVRYVEFVVKKKLKELDYDFIFVDSRTGISDYQNICNIQLVDVNVLLMAPNRQNVDGCIEVAKSIINSPYIEDGHREPIIMPVLSRVEVDSPDFEDFITLFKNKTSFLINNLNNYLTNEINIEDYNEDTNLYYNRFIAIGEHLFFKNNKEKITGFSEKYQNIAEYLLYGLKKYKKTTNNHKEYNSILLSKTTNKNLEREILVEKLNFFREQAAITADATQKFSITKQIEEIEHRLNAINKGFDKYKLYEKIKFHLERAEYNKVFELGDILINELGTTNYRQDYNMLKKQYITGDSVYSNFSSRLDIFFRFLIDE